MRRLWYPLLEVPLGTRPRGRPRKLKAAMAKNAAPLASDIQTGAARPR